MTLFGVIWILLLLIFAIKEDIKYITALLLLSMVFQCTNAVVFKGTGVGPQTITCIVFIIRAAIDNALANKRTRLRLKIGSKQIMLVSMLVLMFVVIFSLKKNNAWETNYIRVIQLGVYMLCALLAGSVGESLQSDFLYKTLKAITIFVLIMGVVQLLMTSKVIPKLSIVQTLLYNDKSTASAFNLGTKYTRLCSVFQEPSYCGCFLAAMFHYFLYYKEKRKENKILIIAIVIELIATMSSTAYLAVAITGVVMVLLGDDNKLKLRVIPLALIGMFIMYYGAYDLLDQVIFSKSSTGSAAVRAQWNEAAIEAFQSSPIYGVGYKCSRASSLYYSLLGELGIVGLISYIIMNAANLIDVILFRKKKIQTVQAVELALVAVIAGQMIACPDLDFCVYWMTMCIVSIATAQCADMKKVK